MKVKCNFFPMCVAAVTVAGNAVAMETVECMTLCFEIMWACSKSTDIQKCYLEATLTFATDGCLGSGDGEHMYLPVQLHAILATIQLMFYARIRNVGTGVG